MLQHRIAYGEKMIMKLYEVTTELSRIKYRLTRSSYKT